MCDKYGCENPTEVFVGWLPGAARGENPDLEIDLVLFPVTPEEEAKKRLAFESRQRCWFGGCREHARWVWKLQSDNGASPVFRMKGQR